MRTETGGAAAADGAADRRPEPSIPRARGGPDPLDRFAVSGLVYTESNDAAEFDRFVLGTEMFGADDE